MSAHTPVCHLLGARRRHGSAPVSASGPYNAHSIDCSVARSRTHSAATTNGRSGSPYLSALSLRSFSMRSRSSSSESRADSTHSACVSAAWASAQSSEASHSSIGGTMCRFAGVSRPGTLMFRPR